MGFPSLSAGRRRPACRGWEQVPDGGGCRARRLLSGGSVSAKGLVRALPSGLRIAGSGVGRVEVARAAVNGWARPCLGFLSQEGDARAVHDFEVRCW